MTLDLVGLGVCGRDTCCGSGLEAGALNPNPLLKLKRPEADLNPGHLPRPGPSWRRVDMWAHSLGLGLCGRKTCSTGIPVLHAGPGLGLCGRGTCRGLALLGGGSRSFWRGRRGRATLHPAPCTLHPAPCTLHPTSASWPVLLRGGLCCSGRRGWHAR